MNKDETSVSYRSKTHSKAEKCLVLLVVLLLLVIAAIAIGFALFYTNEIKDKQGRICLTPGCIKAANIFLESINTEVDPCDDFFEYACGGWLKTHSIPDDKPSLSNFDLMNDKLQNTLKRILEQPVLQSLNNATEKVQVFYRACMDEDSIEQTVDKQFSDYLANLQNGGWPLTMPNWNRSTFDLTMLIAQLRRDGFNSQLVNLAVDVDAGNSSRYILNLDQPDLCLGSKTYYENNSMYRKYMDAYFQFMIASAIQLKAEEVNRDYTSELEQIRNFETSIAEIVAHPNLRRNYSVMYNPRTLRNLTETHKSINWLRLVQLSMPEGVEVDENEIIIVRQPDYFASLEQLLTSGQYDERVVANYLIWRVIADTAWPHLSSNFREAAFQFEKVIRGVEKPKPRWTACIEEIQEKMMSAVGYLYVDKFFTEESKELAVKLIGHLRESFKDLVLKLKWMTDATKQVAIEKADAVKEFVGYPDYIKNVVLLEEEYEGFEATANHFDNFMRWQRFITRGTFQQLRKPVDKDKWHITPAMFNAYYSGAENQIVFPAGILQPPLFALDQPMYMNFGGIGQVIGHELTHGFDDRGRQFDKDGNVKAWWHDEDVANFVEETKCMVSQYDNYTIRANGKVWQLNGTQTQGENIADNGGSKQALQAYKKWVEMNGEEPSLPGFNLTAEQVFYLTESFTWCSKLREDYAIRRILTWKHAVEKYRVIGPLSNSPEFAKAFNCPLGSAMNPVQKCSVW